MNEKSSEAYHESQLYRIRHSTAHLMAAAVLEMFPEGKVAIGPPIENGFYYDFDLPRALTPEDLAKIESRMQALIAERQDFVYQEITPEEGKALFAGQPYKLELIEGILSGGVDEDGEGAATLPVSEAPALSIYKSGAFVDLCRGPHVQNSREINPKAVKLLNVAGAYWRGDEKRPMLQRIYGTAWKSDKDLKTYLKYLEEAKARDHRQLNKRLDFYSMHEELGPGLIVYGPKAGRIRTVVEDYWRQEHFANGYEILYTPHIGLSTLWETSGHLEFFKEGMYAPLRIDEADYYLKPMNCPFHMLAYKAHPHSYRELPLRWAELGTCYRYERSGVLHGLMRPRSFTQDDAHIICTPEQVQDELSEVLRFSLYMWRAFGFDDFVFFLSTRPDKAIGTDEQWALAQDVLRTVMGAQGVNYTIDEGGGAFYGPKIDMNVRDVLGRKWQMATIQFDFNLPERFDMTYIGEDGQEHRPYMVHRTLLGSWERFFGVLIEHYAGAFPVWLAPEQARVIPIADRHIEYAKQVEAALRQAHIRANIDASSSRMNAKIREAQMQKVPYMLVIGDKEVEAGTVAVRLRSGENLGALPLADFIARAEKAIAEHTLE
ncbi:MAG: threonine--tRNA ligase [Anaerolineae bacterium]|nr:threonine--tRNA ligase [Anaerolineae bacterium]